MSIPLQLTLPSRLYRDMGAQALAERPHECCGLLAGTIEPDAAGVLTAVVRERYPLRNAAASPVRYEGDPADLCRAHRDMRRRGLEPVAIYHSHPTSPPVPSRTDLELNFYGEEVLHLIVSLQQGEPEVRCWRLGPDAAATVPWSLAPDEPFPAWSRGVVPMPFDPLAPLPLLTAALPGVGGRIKVEPEDFEVEEVPAYEPCGTGPFLYLWVEKRDMGAEYFVRQVAQRLGISPGEVGTAGLKDRRAVTRQRVSVPAECEPRLAALEGDGVRVLQVSRHGNKLRPGHLHGNRFRILVRDADPAATAGLEAVLGRLRTEGLPNFYGPQRFGRGGETVALGLALLHGQPPPLSASGRRMNTRSPFLRKLALSAAQSALFNHYLARRLADGLLRRVLAGDVMAKWPFGGMFVAEDVAREQERFDARETVTAGPMFGRKTFPAGQEALAREEQVLREAGLERTAFNPFGKLLQGTRRHNLVYVDDLAAAVEPDGVRLTFTLPAGCYATVLLREVMKVEPADPDEVPPPASGGAAGETAEADAQLADEEP